MDSFCLHHRPLFMSQGESPSSIDADGVSTFVVLQWNDFWMFLDNGTLWSAKNGFLLHPWIGKDIAFPLGP